MAIARGGKSEETLAISASSRHSQPHSAAGSAAGYLYQGEYALLELVRRLETGGSLSLEIFDDVAFHPEEGGDAREQLQLKHTIGDTRVMTDESTDLWKTISIWCDEVPSDPQVAARAFTLVTVHRVPPDSAASLLRPEPDTNREPHAALGRLETIAEGTTDGPRADYCRRFLRLSRTERETLFESLSVLDDAPNALQVDQELEAQIGMAVPRAHRQAFLEALKGWWARQVLEMYFGRIERVDTQEVEVKIDQLREGFAGGAVAPITIDAQAHPGPAEDYEQMAFIEQLRLISVAQERLNNAIRDYYRASAQRGEWERTGSVLPSELSAYETRLIDEWRTYRGVLIDKFDDDFADEAMKVQFGRQIYEHCEIEVNIGPRPRLSAPADWLCRGSWHILADKVRLGWHPDFATKIAERGGQVGAG